MNTKEKNEKAIKAKETLSNFWQKTSSVGKKAAEGAKSLADQTKKNIHDAQAKKYIPVTEADITAENFNCPSIIEVVDDSANREFICEDAIGWIEKHKETNVLHMYFGFAKNCDFEFVPMLQRGNVYCEHNFDIKKFISADDFFERVRNEKLAELSDIAFCLGAKRCSVEIKECDSSVDKNGVSATVKSLNAGIGLTLANGKVQEGKKESVFGENNAIKEPQLKWFLHDDNIKRLIRMRCVDGDSIKSEILELKGSSSSTINLNVACAVDAINSRLSMEKNAVKQHSSVLIYEIEF